MIVSIALGIVLAVIILLLLPILLVLGGFAGYISFVFLKILFTHQAKPTTVKLKGVEL